MINNFKLEVRKHLNIELRPERGEEVSHVVIRRKNTPGRESVPRSLSKGVPWHFHLDLTFISNLSLNMPTYTKLSIIFFSSKNDIFCLQVHLYYSTYHHLTFYQLVSLLLNFEQL